MHISLRSVSRVRFAVGSLALVAALAPLAPASAQTSGSGSNDLIHACYVPGSGTMYRILAEGTKDACSSKNHTLFSWGAGSSMGGGFELPFFAAVQTTVPTFRLHNDGTAPTTVFTNDGNSHALFARSNSNPSATIHAENLGQGATGYFESKGGGSALMGLALTGGGLGVMGISEGPGAAGHFENRSTGPGVALSASSTADFAAVSSENHGAGGAFYGRNSSEQPTMFLQNEGVGGAIFAKNSSPNYVAAHIENTAAGDATALLALGHGGSAVYGESTSDLRPTAGFRNYGTEGALGVYAEGSAPALQVNHLQGGEAVGVNGRSHFNGNVLVVGDLQVTGQKNAVVPTSEGMRAVHAEESTEVWFTDHGFGRLVDGVAWISVDPLYGEIVSLDRAYHVFVEEYGNAEVYVSRRTAEGFEVRLREGQADVEFSYRVMAKRRGFEEQRLNPANSAGAEVVVR